MVEEFQTSFIPKKSAETGVKPSRRPSTSMNLLALGGVILFVLALLASGGVFAYTRLLENDLVDKQEALERSQEAFEPSLIRELVRLDQRFESADSLLTSHMAMSNVLAFLEEHTLEKVQFTTFGLSQSNGEFGLSLSGVASGFEAVALQSDEFGEHVLLSEVVFSGFSVISDGGVSFSVAMKVDPSIFEYEPAGESVVEVEEAVEDTDEVETGDDEASSSDDEITEPEETL